MKRKDIYIVIIISFLIELLVFNFSFFKTIFYSESSITNYSFNDIEFDKQENEYYISGDDPYVELEINQKIKNIYIDLSTTKKRNVNFTLKYTDDLQKEFVNIDDQVEISYDVVSNIERSKYIDCQHVGNTHKIRLSIDLDMYMGFDINSIEVNKSVPLMINSYRYFAILAITSFIYFFKSNLLKKSYDNKNKKQKIIYYIVVGSFIVLSLCVYARFGELNNKYADFYTTSYVDALAEGELSLGKYDQDVEDLYDYSVRSTEHNNYIMDASYYNGNIYVYFGMLPALILVFFKLININLTGYFLAGVFMVIAIIMSAKLVRKIIYKYYPKTSFRVFLLLLLLYLFNCRLFLLLISTRFYELLVLMSYTLAISSIYFVIKATEKKLNYKYLFISNILLALQLFVRPNMVLIGIVNLYYLYPFMKDKRYDLKKVIYTLIPCIILLFLTLYINYIRYDSIFEFGQSYQLTITNNSIKPNSIYAVINGIYSYLFRVPIFSTIFPFVNNSLSIVYYNTYYYNTSCGNGIIPMSILGILLLYTPWIKDKSKKGLIVMFLIVGLLILSVSANFGGTVNRYNLEFIFLFIIAIILVVLELLNTKFQNEKEVINILLVIVLISCFMNFLVAFDYDKVDNFIKYNDSIYYVKNLFKT